MTSTPRLSVVIVTWNSAHLIERCLKPLMEDSELEVIVWDNNSSDETCEIVASAFPKVRLISNGENLGFGKANNEAFKLCRGEFILLLNPDAFLDEQGSEPLHGMLNYLGNHPDVAAVGPQLVHEDGRHQVGDSGWRTTLVSISGHALALHKILPFWPSIYLSNKSLLLRDAVPVDWICGACLLVRAEVVAMIGGFADDIFMYGEDVEWGERMRGAGYNVHYLPPYKVLHIQGGTQKKAGKVYASTKWMDAELSGLGESDPP